MSEELREKSMKDLLKDFDVKRIKSGDILKGKVIDVNDKEVAVNIDYAFDGVITREENYNSLHQNGLILWLKRDISALPIDDRPLSQIKSPIVLYEERKPLYEKFADITIEISDDKNITYNLIKDAIKAYREEKRWKY